MNTMLRPVTRLFLVLLVLTGGQALDAPELGAQELDIQDAYYRSYGYERTQDYMNAIRALSGVFETYPEGYTVNLRMAWLYYLNGNYANAMVHYDTALRVAPYALEPKLGSLLPLLAQERWADVESQAYQIVSVDYYNYYGNLRLAVALRMQGKLEQARQVVNKMLTPYPTDTLYLTQLGLIAVAEGDEAAARVAFTDVLILDPESPEAKAYFDGG
jgi:tetratricopeptide (TPR) repeat protein